MVARYLELLSAGRGDRGWSLLHPDVRRPLFNSDAAAHLKAIDLKVDPCVEVITFAWMIDRSGNSLTSSRGPLRPAFNGNLSE